MKTHDIASRVTIIDLLQIFGNGIKNLEVSTIEVKVRNSSLGDTCHCGKHIKAPNDFDASFHQKSCRHWLAKSQKSLQLGITVMIPYPTISTTSTRISDSYKIWWQLQNHDIMTTISNIYTYSYYRERERECMISVYIYIYPNSVLPYPNSAPIYWG